jgi:hypothetical protein
MARELLVTNYLSKEMITAGKKLIKRLKNEIDLKAVCWAYISDIHEWTLVLISDDFKTDGPRKIYHCVLEANKKARKKENILSILNVSISSNLGKFDDVFKQAPPQTAVRMDDVYIYPQNEVKSKSQAM